MLHLLQKSAIGCRHVGERSGVVLLGAHDARAIVDQARSHGWRNVTTHSSLQGLQVLRSTRLPHCHGTDAWPHAKGRTCTSMRERSRPRGASPSLTAAMAAD